MLKQGYTAAARLEREDEAENHHPKLCGCRGAGWGCPLSLPPAFRGCFAPPYVRLIQSSSGRLIAGTRPSLRLPGGRAPGPLSPRGAGPGSGVTAGAQEGPGVAGGAAPSRPHKAAFSSRPPAPAELVIVFDKTSLASKAAAAAAPRSRCL